MTIDDKIRDEKLQYDTNREAADISKHQHYHQVKLINMNILQVKKYYLHIKVECQNKFSCSPLGKALEKQTTATVASG